MAVVVELSPSVTVRSIAELRQALLEGFEAGDQIELDAGNVAEVDLSFLQLIHAARDQAQRDGKTIRLRQPAGPAIAALLERAGFLAAAAPDDLDFWFHGESPQ